MAKDFLAKGQPFKRKVQTYTAQLSATSEAVLEQLCPTREVDWLDGWIADLVYTDSGYAEPDCILTTPEACVLGAGLWIVTRRVANKLHEFVVIREDGVVGHFTIELVDNGDGTCESSWTLVFTAINKEGNAVIEAMPDKNSDFEALVLGGLEHFLKTGERMEITR
jgi:hypothetical protein